MTAQKLGLESSQSFADFIAKSRLGSSRANSSENYPSS